MLHVVRLAPEETSIKLTGYEHNAVTCIGMKTDIPVSTLFTELVFCHFRRSNILHIDVALEMMFWALMLCMPSSDESTIKRLKIRGWLRDIREP